MRPFAAGEIGIVPDDERGLLLRQVKFCFSGLEIFERAFLGSKSAEQRFADIAIDIVIAGDNIEPIF